MNPSSMKLNCRGCPYRSNATDKARDWQLRGPGHAEHQRHVIASSSFLTQFVIASRLIVNSKAAGFFLLDIGNHYSSRTRY